MRRLAPWLCCLPLACCLLSAASSSEWTVARSSNFEVYLEGDGERARQALLRFEELRQFFASKQVSQTKKLPSIFPVNSTPVRVIEFQTRSEFDGMKPTNMADAYYTGGGERDYIVTTISAKDDLSIAAHEYTHFVLHSDGLRLPAWLSEGLAEVFSTLTITGKSIVVGGRLPVRVETLHRQRWLLAGELMNVTADSPLRKTRDGAAIFYAESWALVDLLTSLPEFAPRFGDLVTLMNGEGVSAERALMTVYGKSPEQLLSLTQRWVTGGGSVRHAMALSTPEGCEIAVQSLSELQARKMKADLLFVNGFLDRAQERYQELLKQNASDPEVLAALGNVALSKGDKAAAIDYWRRALNVGLIDAALCFRYAVLAEDAGLPRQESERALLSAISAKQDFDDARYRLALLESNAGEYAEAVKQLQAMARPVAGRAFSYWSAMSYSMAELGRRAEAEAAATEALKAAQTVEERSRAQSLAMVAKTDLTVRFERKADGNLQLTTVRVPHGSNDFNPFIEPEDRLQIVWGKLREVQCSRGQLTAFVVESERGTLTLAVPDPLHVLMRNSPPEFSCGEQKAEQVRVEYAAQAKPDEGLLRGMAFQ